MTDNLQITERTIRESERLAQSALDGLAAHIAILDSDGRIVAVNRAWRRFAEANLPEGQTLESSAFAEGANYLAVCDLAAGTCSEEALTAAQGIRAVLADAQELFTLEYPCHAPEEPRWFALRVTRFPGEGPARVVVSHENITERKHAEETLRHRVEELAALTQRLEHKNQELDQFAYVTSHDLKAPLRGIANLSRWIEEDMAGQISDEVKGHLELMRGRVNRMEAMIEGILAYSRIGRIVVKPERVDVGELLADCLDLLSPPPDFVIEIQDVMPILYTDRVPLEQVFMNLISNAIKHHRGPAPGHVRVSAREKGAWWEFEVADNGPGIAPQYHDKVFVIFQTLEARDKTENTGVGLSLVKKIIESQGGTIHLESREGEGATFRFTWPKKLQQKETPYV